mgnify:FL=1
MKSSRYTEISNLVQVIGCVYKNPKIFEKEDKYTFKEHDFYDDFHKIVFTCIYQLWQLGAKEITLPAIEDYLSQRPKAAGFFKANNGAEFLLRAADNANLSTFDYYYNRMKKMSLLRGYESLGMDLDWLYNPDEIHNLKKKQEQEDWLDNATVREIDEKINDKIDAIRESCVEDVQEYGCQLGTGIDELLDNFAKTPAIGYPFYDIYFSTVTRGARLGKFYLRSAATNVGKTRAAIADACYIGCSQMYDADQKKWITTGAAESVLFIATEQEIDEIQPSALAFLSGVEEDHIQMNNYYAGEWERIEKAKQLLKQGKVQFVCLPDFGTEDIEIVIKKHIREKQVKYVFFDYIHTSTKIISEIGGGSGIKLREDNILFLMSSKLKEIALKHSVCIVSSTQLNASYQTSETPDQNLLRGSKAIADRVDWGGILLEVTKDDKEKITQFCNKNNLPIPNVKLSVYKSRANKWKGIYLWMVTNPGICSYKTYFVTDWAYNVIDLPLLKIEIQDESAF